MSAAEGPTIVTGGPANHTAPPLPTEPRTTDVDAWRAEIEAKRGRRPPSILRDRPTTTTAEAPRPPARETPAPVASTSTRPGRRALSARTALGRQVVEEYLAGASMIDLARRHHLAQASVRRILDDAGVEIRQRGGAGKAAAAAERGDEPAPRAAPFTPEQVARFAARYVLHGEGLGVIAAAEGVDRDRVRAALVAAGVEIRAVGSHRLPDPAATSTTSTPDPPPAPPVESAPPPFPPAPPPPGPPTLDEWLFDLAMLLDLATTVLARGRALQADLEKGSAP